MRSRFIDRRGQQILIAALATIQSPFLIPALAQEPRLTNAQDLEARYERLEFDGVVAALARVADWQTFEKQVERGMNAWPRNVGAAFTLEAAVQAAAAADEDPRVAAYSAALRLLEIGGQRLRAASAPSEFERRWDLATLALLEGAGPEMPFGRGLLLTQLPHVQQRFPGNSEVAFADAFSQEQDLLAWVSFQGVEVAHPTTQNQRNALSAVRSVMSALATRYESLGEDPVVGLEATLHRGVVLWLRDDAEAALPAFHEAAGRSTDERIQYLVHFFSARALTSLSRRDEAIAEYRRALEVRPGTQSAQLSLAALLFAADRREEAATLTRAVLAAPSGGGDPWAWYPYGDFRRLPDRLAAMRRALQ